MKMLGKGDLKYRIKVCRKESKESIHFLGLVETFGVKELENEREFLIDEANQFKKIFSTMLTNIIEKKKIKSKEIDPIRPSDLEFGILNL